MGSSAVLVSFTKSPSSDGVFSGSGKPISERCLTKFPSDEVSWPLDWDSGSQVNQLPLSVFLSSPGGNSRPGITSLRPESEEDHELPLHCLPPSTNPLWKPVLFSRISVSREFSVRAGARNVCREMFT